jgi:hypothetical protein
MHIEAYLVCQGLQNLTYILFYYRSTTIYWALATFSVS